MSMPKNETQKEIVESWRTFVNSMEKSLNQLEKDIQEAKEMAGVCTDEWCESTQHVIDELSNSLSRPMRHAPMASIRVRRTVASASGSSTFWPLKSRT